MKVLHFQLEAALSQRSGKVTTQMPHGRCRQKGSEEKMATAKPTKHSAEAAALGFYYQSLFGLLAVQRLPHDDAAVVLERLDDVELKVEGGQLLAQLKHTLSAAPGTVTISARQLWDTLRAWIDTLPRLVLSETEFRLVTVAPIDESGPLAVLLKLGSDRSSLITLLIAEAQRVVAEHTAGQASGATPVPHKDRVKACQAFLDIDDTTRLELLNRTIIESNAPNIAEISAGISKTLVNFPPDKRNDITAVLIQWWDYQVIFSLCGKRDRSIRKLEVLQEISEIACRLERDELVPMFESEPVPDEHKHDSILERQIRLVNGSSRELNLAIREEWRARSQRDMWMVNRLGMSFTITQYDKVLKEKWADKHAEICEDCDHQNAAESSDRGRKVLKWALSDAYNTIRPMAPNWNASYYVTGSLQVLAISQEVGWHPNYKHLLSGGK